MNETLGASVGALKRRYETGGTSIGEKQPRNGRTSLTVAAVVSIWCWGASTVVPTVASLGEEAQTEVPVVSALDEEVSTVAAVVSIWCWGASTVVPTVASRGKEASMVAAVVSALSEEAQTEVPVVSGLSVEVSMVVSFVSCTGASSWGVVSARIQQTSYAIPARTWHEAREWLLGAAVVSAGGGLVWLRCLWAVAGPGCGACGRWRGLAGLRDDAPSGARGADGERAGRRPRAHRAALPTRGGRVASRKPRLAGNVGCRRAADNTRCRWLAGSARRLSGPTAQGTERVDIAGD